MNPEIKAQWVAALRSGEYEQGKGSLHTRKNGEDTFCCLGVLCDLAVKAGVATPLPVNDVGDIAYQGVGSTRANAYYIPGPIAEWAGFVDNRGFGVEADPIVKINDIPRHVSSHNDTIGVSFSDIANAIEGQVPGE